MKEKYLNCNDLWDDIPELRNLAECISPDDNDSKHLHPAQLIKHILGLRRKFGCGGFRLLYLWYDVLGEEGKVHRDEAMQFASLAKNDGIKFHSLTYQELIVKLASQIRPNHVDYIRYLTERYLYLYAVTKQRTIPNQTLEMDWAKPCRFLKGSI